MSSEFWLAFISGMLAMGILDRTILRNAAHRLAYARRHDGR